MSLTFNLILALFLLAPGLGIFAGVYAGGRRPFRPAAAEPGSIHALALVAIGSLFCHALCAWFFVWMQRHCERHACWRVAFDPNPYEIILQLRDGFVRSGAAGTGLPSLVPAITADGLAWLFSSLLLIGCFGFLLGLLVVAIVGRTGLLRPTLYGWIDELLRQANTKAHVFTAYVLTDTAEDGRLLGYEGSLLDLRQSHSGEIRVVVLKDAEPFVVHVNQESALRQKTEKLDKTIPFLTIEGAHITNVAFRPYLDPRRLSDREYERMKAAGDLDVGEDETAVTVEPLVPRAEASTTANETAEAAASQPVDKKPPTPPSRRRSPSTQHAKGKPAP